MAERGDVTIEWARSPRIVRVDDPSTEFIIQDIVDTLRGTEEELDNLDDDSLLDAAGKEELGGGVLVGITTTLRNTQISFDDRTTPSETGTVTTADPTGEVLIDSTALFQTNGVIPGSAIINFTDLSLSTVISVDSEIQLTHYPLTSGTENDWDFGDVYRIYPIVQCEVSGGNVVALDDIGDPISAIFPSLFTQIVRTSASSATLQELEAIQHSSFNNAVCLDVAGGTPGTVFPAGTTQQPVNNLVDAKIIAAARGFTTLMILGNVVFGAGDDLTGFTLIGESHAKTMITLGADAVIDAVEIADATINGVLDGKTVLHHCYVQGLNYVEGEVYESVIEGTVVLSGAEAYFINCWSGLPDVGDVPTFDLNGGGTDLNIKQYSGNLKITNTNQPDNIRVDLVSGNVEIDPTVTAGDITLRGVGTFLDNSSGTTLDTGALLNLATIASGVWDEILTGTEHNIPTSAGRRLREIAGKIIHTGFAQAGSGANWINLSEDASTTDGAYDPSLIAIIGGPGQGQSRLVYEYDGTLKRAIIDRNWKVIPEATSEYIIYANPGREHVNEGMARGGTSNTITLNNLASDIDGVYNQQIIFLRSGTGEDQVRIVIEYDGTTKIATIFDPWDIIPNGSTGYVMLPTHIYELPNTAAAVADAVWDEAMSEHTVAGSTAEFLRNMMGMIGENVKWSGMTHDSNHNLTAATITQYTDKTLTVIKKQWVLAATYDSGNELLTYELKEV